MRVLALADEPPHAPIGELVAANPVDLLKTVRSVVDVRISIWNAEAAGWRVLSPGEQRAIWDLRDR